MYIYIYRYYMIRLCGSVDLGFFTATGPAIGAPTAIPQQYRGVLPVSHDRPLSEEPSI